MNFLPFFIKKYMTLRNKSKRRNRKKKLEAKKEIKVK
jgi:hypothetical protein